MITAEQVSELLHYDPVTGAFTRKVRTANRIKIGEIAGGVDSHGYRHVRLLGKYYKAHRLAWLITNREWPQHDIDHINGLRDDNRIENLRAVTRLENMRNQKTRSTNTSGTMGVTWHKQNCKWAAQICIDGKRVHLGYFTSLAEAVATRKTAENAHGFHKNHGRSQA